MISWSARILRGDTKSLNEIGRLIRQHSETTRGTVEYSHAGAEKIIGYSKLVNGWTLALIQPRQEIYKPAWELSLFIALLSFLSIVISVFYSEPVYTDGFPKAK